MRYSSIMSGLFASFSLIILGPLSARADQLPQSIRRYGKPAEVFFAAGRAYRNGKYEHSSDLLDAFWKISPPGSDVWKQYRKTMAQYTPRWGTNVGNPPFYYALRMLTACSQWRRSIVDQQADNGHEILLTVVLVGHAKGKIPRSQSELLKAPARNRQFNLHPGLAANNQILDESLWLFREYVAAISKGALTLQLEYLHLANTTVPVEVRMSRQSPNVVAGDKRGYAGLAKGWRQKIWDDVNDKLLRQTDWWWVIYPSAVPNDHQLNANGFVSGGMGAGPDGRSPCFMSEDLFLIRKNVNLGKGRYTSEERRAYMPQWLQHEFYHHLFLRYPVFHLEDKSHQWFDRKSWPDDFVGQFEPDYYREALFKRIIPQGEPPLPTALRYARPVLDPRSIEGRYSQHPRQNDWHQGRIAAVTNQPGKFIWTNNAGKSWGLTLDAGQTVLQTDRENPYFDTNPRFGRDFRLALDREDGSGKTDYRVKGFRFQSGYFFREAD